MSTKSGDEETPVPVDLRAEYEREPTNLLPATDHPPRLSWRLPIGRDIEQTAYHVRVATDAAALPDEGDVWDSGRVDSSRSTTIEYGGAPLEADTEYYWAVRLWDGSGNASDWSEPATFATAIPDTDEHWTGEWIGPEEAEIPGAEWTDYTFEAEFTIEANAAGFVFRAADGGNFYMWQIALATYEDPAITETMLRPHVWVDGAPVLLDEIPIDDVLEGREHERHHVEITVDGTEITFAIDGTVIDTRTDDAHGFGTIGFRQYSSLYGDEHVSVDSVGVTAPDGTVLFTDTFDDELAPSFPDGEIVDEQLELQGTGVVLYEGDRPPSSPLLRRETVLENPIESARAHVVTLGYGELYVNGERIGDQQLDPAKTEYGERVLYSTYDIEDQLEEGDNAVGLWLGRGWFSKDFDQWQSYGPPRALVQLEVTYDDGSSDVITTDDSWRLAESPLLENDLFDGEVYDARLEMSGWADPGFDDGDWEHASTGEPPAAESTLRPQRIDPIRVTDTFEPAAIVEREDGYLVDFGQNLAGWVELTIRGAEEGDEIVLEHAETLLDDGELTRDLETGSLNLVDLRDADATDTYVARGDEVETYEPRFTYHGFRYALVRGYPGTLSPDDIRSKAVHTDFDVRGQFECANKELNQVQHNAAWSLRTNAHSIPTDCPQRNERAGWTEIWRGVYADLFNFSAERFYEKWLRDHADNQAADGSQSATVPQVHGGFPTDPNWSKSQVMVPWALYEHTGDDHILEENYDEMRAYVDFWHERADGNLLSTDWLIYGDWLAPEGVWVDAPLLSTFAYYQITETMASVAAAVGREADRERYDSRASAIAEAFNDAHFDPETATYGTGSQKSFVIPLFLGLVPEEHEAAVAENLATKIEAEDGGKLQTGTITTRALLYVLGKYGHEELAYHVVSQPEQPGWVYMVRNGATALWEHWDGDEQIGSGMNSFNHRLWMEISAWFYRTLAGIDAAEPGFEHVEIAPMVPDDLEWAEAETETVRGPVASRWERIETPGDGRERDGLTLETTIPGNSTATVEIPTLGGETVRVREDGKTIWNNGNRTRPNHPGIEDVSREGNRIVVDITNGEYEFELEQLGN